MIESIKFGLLSPDDIRKMSVVEIQTSDTYDEDGTPIPSGLMDGRLGSLEPRQRCKTCGNLAALCPGHFGHIELAAPVIHIEFIKIIHMLLLSTCKNCGRILLPEDEIKEYLERIEREKKLLGSVSSETYQEIFRKAKRATRCPHCGARKFKIKYVKPTTFYEVEEHEIEVEGGKVVETVDRRLIPDNIREWFTRIPDEDLKLFGFDPSVARPEWMILTVLPVPPVTVRPSIILESGIRAEDDLTHKLVDIIRINQRLRENREAGAPALIVEDLSELLQYHVTTYFNNEVSGIPPARHRSGRALKSLTQRLKGKEGRFRGNLSGKRVDFSARTVISPDPNLDINEVGVPLYVAMKLTVPERVTEFNIEEMRQLVRNGPDKYPGATYVIRPDGKRKRLEFADREKVAEALEPGYIVERHLRDGDIVLFNRQPSLHRMSIMAHRVKVLPYRTFRLHLSVCPPYNADFDGDEMNLHVPQSEEARTEARLLMQVQDHILSPRYGAPIIGAHKDFITGAYLLTKKSTLLTKAEVGKLLTATGYDGPIPEPDIEEPEPLWSGKKIFSLFLPKDFNFVTKASICRKCSKCLKEKCPYDAYVVIKNGQLICGVIDKSSIGAEKPETVFHRIVKDYGTEVGRKFLNSICTLVNEFLSMRGFTYAVDELEIGRREKRMIDQAIRKAERNIQKLIQLYKSGQLRRLPGQTLEDTFEIQVMNELAKARDEAGEIVNRFTTMDNSGIIMARTGARGSSLNIGQMMACIGQQSIRGKRVRIGYVNRTLPHFKEGDESPAARGFIYSCYRDGLNPIEFFFHAMGGREGLVDTAVRTQQSGYMQRRLINALEHLRVEYDGTVRDSEGNIIQFRYGEDGVDPMKSDHGKAVNVKRLIECAKLAYEGGEPAPKEYINKALERVKDRLTPAILRDLKLGLYKAGLTRELVDKVVSEAIRSYGDALVEAGEAVGTVAAQSIGEPGTQMTLRTFHFAGVRELNVTLGLPRLIEIVDARRIPSTPMMTVYLDKEHRSDPDKAAEVARRLVETRLKDIWESIEVDLAKGVAVIRLDPKSVSERGVTPEDLKEAFEKIASDISEGRIVVKLSRLKLYDPEKVREKLEDRRIKGIKGIRRALAMFENKEWVIKTEGSNLVEVLKVPGVDPTRTTTNDIHEIAEVFGIVAARNAIINEAMGVLTEQGLDVDIRHIMLVADMMTHLGSVQQIGRHGVSGEKASVLARAAFELTVQHIVEAAVRGEEDKLKGVVENIIIGQSIPLGTGSVDLLMATEEIAR